MAGFPDNRNSVSMKKVSFVILFFLTVLPAVADIPANYYTRLDGKKKEQLKTAAYEIISPHTVVTYNSLFPQQFPKTDVYPDLYNGQQRWWEMYSDEVFYVNRGWKGMNREHSLPKSWWGGAQNDAYTDLFHLYPSEADANMAKSNYPLGEVETAKFDNGVSCVGYAVEGQGGGAGMVFEPADEYKGDFARTYFYMATAYQNLTWKYTYMFQTGDYPTLKTWASNLLLSWHRADPVSQKELDRNEAVYQIQGNRNPFIDFPELAEYVWGTRTNETFYIADQGGNITPPITGDPELLSPAANSSLDFGQVAVGSSQTIELLVKGVNLTSSLSIRVTGVDRAMFALTGVNENQIPASKVNSDTGYRLSVCYTPSSEGVHTAAITLYDGGFSAGTTFNVAITGEACPIPMLSTLTATAATDITENSYQANWITPEEAVDYYIVTRNRYSSSGVTTTELIAEENYLVMDDRQVDIEESYTVQSVRLGYKSEPSNMIRVMASGVNTTEDCCSFKVLSVAGGIRVSTEVSLTIYDVSGLIVSQVNRPTDNLEIPLSSGVYFIVAEGSAQHAKLIVR